MNAVESLKYFIPELVLLGGAFVVFAADFFAKNKRSLGLLSLLVIVLTACLYTVPEKPLPLFFGAFYLDSFAHFFRLLALAVVGVTLLISYGYAPLHGKQEGEFYGLLLLAAFALTLVAAANDLLMIFLAVEFVSLVSYVLVGFLKNDAKSKEAALKYLLFGSVCSGIMLYGMSLVYGAAGSLELPVIGNALFYAPFKPLSAVAVLCFFVGLGFKISMAPFHMWAPDVYEGAPTPVTAFLAVAPKALGFAVLMRVLATVFGLSWEGWSLALTALSILTMTIGNLTAISQTNMKRFLAYSSIAQAGYILMGLAVFTLLGREAILIYLAAYLLTNLGAFAVVTFVSEETGSDDISNYAGLSERSPVAAALLTVFLLSLTGLPPLAGFVGKYYVFAAAIHGKFITLAIVAAVNSVIAAYYYFRIIRMMYLTPASGPALANPPRSIALAFWIMFAGVIAMGVFPSFFLTRILK
ncbi:MAG TPA: NADH-quinone oxidoreductase subunit N [Candidatus Omnitrophota bacterium]|nr:NADH-quinone oxidoreductase subunit N [Candidatus Omnitrophota bacterium]HPS36100.1 NADH-quinone oxidoreductase subunit N [Candidatus Omnitrophota bacterium]